MQVSVDTRNPVEADVELLALLLPQIDARKWRLPARLGAVDSALGGRISAVISSRDFRGKAGETLLLYPAGDELSASRVLLAGLGPEGDLDADTLRRAAGTVVGQARAKRASSVAIAVSPSRRVRPATAAQALAEGALLADYRFDGYKEKPKKEDEPVRIDSVALSFDRGGDLRAARTAAQRGVVLAESQNLARDLSNLPANDLTPVELARRAERAAREVGLRSDVLDVPELRRRKMNAILAVGGGSANPPRLVVLEHNAPPRSRKKTSGRRLPTVCLVGKGITFDTGGISIKPAASMDEMKHDMSGAAVVVGVLRACALLKLPLHVVGVNGAAENMPSGTAYRPGDVVRAMSGKTIEVLNTDAEGRVVLADALHYARTQFEPRAMVDLATLTGACVVALGSCATGVFTNQDRLAEHLHRAGDSTAERVWQMPLWEEHRKAVRSEVADIKNTAGREAASSTAAAFLAAFVHDTPWAHLDIAGTSWTGKPGPYQPRGATGVGVRLLVEALQGFRRLRLD